jgi:hypothetical protein
VADVSKANANDEILRENMEQLYKEVDELRAKMDMPLSKPRPRFTPNEHLKKAMAFFLWA